MTTQGKPGHTGDLVERLEWPSIDGWPYEVSRCGRVRNIRSGEALKPIITRYGYLRAILSNNGLRKGFAIHRLVYAAWVGPLIGGLQINHIDAIKTNNFADNLEQVTPRENIEHAVRLGLNPRGDRHRSRTKPESLHRGNSINHAKLNDPDIIRIRALSAEGRSGPQIARQYGVHNSTIWLIVRRKTWAHL